MKIKHWAGYGNIGIYKKAQYTFPDDDGATVTMLVVTLRGNHEQGLWNKYRSSDPQFIWNYIIKRYDKSYNEKPRFISVVSVNYGICAVTKEEECYLQIAYRN